MFHTYILLASACLPLVSASVYPTQPVQATVWSADQPMLVNWIEDRKYPRLDEMGPLDISLWCNTDTYLASLASGVDPMTKTYQVTVPGWTLKQGQGYKYTLRFATNTPIDTVVYSADFAIVPANSTTTGAGAAALATQSGTGARSGAGNGTETGSGIKTGPTSAGSSSTTSTGGASGRFGSTTPSGVPPPSGAIPSGGIPGAQQQRTASAARRAVDVEKLKFRFVFVMWPVVMGITMAL